MVLKVPLQRVVRDNHSRSLRVRSNLSLRIDRATITVVTEAVANVDPVVMARPHQVKPDLTCQEVTDLRASMVPTEEMVTAVGAVTKIIGAGVPHAAARV